MNNKDIPLWVCAHADGNVSTPDTLLGVGYVRRKCTSPDGPGSMCARCLDNIDAFKTIWPFPGPQWAPTCRKFTPRRMRGVNKL